MFDPDQPRGPLTSSALGLGSSEALLRQQAPVRPGLPLAPPGIAPESDVRTHSPSAAARTESVQPPEPEGWAEGLGQLPSGYGDNRLVCLPRDPTCAFVYWDLSPQQIAQAFEGMSGARALLKLIHLSGALLREVDVHLEMRGFYLYSLPSGAEFRVELWAAGERSSRLLRSTRPVRLPPAEPSSIIDEQYLHIELESPLSSATLEGDRPKRWPASLEFLGGAGGAGAPDGKVSPRESRIGYPPFSISGAGLSGEKR